MASPPSLARPWTAATSTTPARAAAAPPRKQAMSENFATDSPAIRAARTLPPTILVAKPCVVRSRRTQARMQPTTPNSSPQCMSVQGSFPMIVGICELPLTAKEEGASSILGSCIGPSTQWLRILMAM